MFHKINLTLLFSALISAFAFLHACTEPSSKKSDDLYQKSQETMQAAEEKNPAKFLSATVHFRKNLVGQTVIKGEISSRAKVVSYKDVDIRISFFSQTGALLEEDREKIYETIAPGGKTSFKSKYFAPRGTDSVRVTVMGAAF